jgi:hypothetical protein
LLSSLLHTQRRNVYHSSRILFHSNVNPPAFVTHYVGVDF